STCACCQAAIRARRDDEKPSASGSLTGAVSYARAAVARQSISSVARGRRKRFIGLFLSGSADARSWARVLEQRKITGSPRRWAAVSWSILLSQVRGHKRGTLSPMIWSKRSTRHPHPKRWKLPRPVDRIALDRESPTVPAYVLADRHFNATIPADDKCSVT